MRHFDLFKRLLSGRYASLVFVIAFGIVSGLCGVALLALINLSLHTFNNFDGKDALIFIALATIVLITQVISSIGMARFVQTTVRDLRLQLGRQIMVAPFSVLQKLGTARLMANLTEDVSVITNALQLVSQLCISMAWLLGGLAYMAWLSLDLFMFVISVLALGIAIYYLSLRIAMRPLHSAREQNDALYAHFRALTQGIKELKLHRNRAQDFLNNGLATTAKACCQFNISAMTFFIFAAAWGGAILYFLVGAMFYGMHRWWEITDETVVSGYILTFLYIIGPISTIINSIPDFGRAKVSFNKIENLYHELADNLDATGAALPNKIPAQPCVLELKEVCYRYHYDGNSFTLGPLNLMFNPGELVFITGGNGSGKSSLALLLVGLYIPAEGAVMLDGKLITDANREGYRQQFSAIFSDFYLFESLLGLRDERIDEKAIRYLKQLQLDHKVSVKNGVLSTITLSQGQRKRLALLTAYLEDRPFYVFDEWAADQDPLFKEIFYTTILTDLKARGKTVIVITHDDRYFHIADRHMRMEDGQITEITAHLGIRNPKINTSVG